MITNPSFDFNRNFKPKRSPSSYKTISETICVSVLDVNGKPTDEVREMVVTKQIEEPRMLIDQTLSADDLTISSCLENGIPLRETNFRINDDSPEAYLINIQSQINAFRDRFKADPAAPVAEPEPNEPSNPNNE